MNNYIIYTDGACSGNPGPGGYGVVIHDSNDHYITKLSGGEPDTTNNRMELTAVIRGLSEISQPSSILVVTDSKYIVDSINKGWARGWANNNWRKSDGKPALNVDLWRKLLELIDNNDSVNFQWVKGHAGHPQNERCDELARSEIANIRSLYG